MSIWSDLLGTTKGFFRIGGTSGVRLKNSTGNLSVRNAGDSADASITASEVDISGDLMKLNSDAAGSGADWTYTIQRPTSGMSSNVALTLPVDDGTSGQILSTDGSGTLSWVSAGSTSLADKLDTTTLAYNSTSPVAMFTTGAADIVDYIEVIIDTAFDGTPTASVGISGTASKYVGTTDIDLTQPAGTAFLIHPNLAAQGAESLILTYSQGGATAGSARVIVHYATPA